MKELSTDLDRDQQERIDPIVHRHLILMVLSALVVGIFCGVGIVFTLLNSDMIDTIKPEYQVTIVAVTFTAFGVIRFVIWIRKTF